VGICIAAIFAVQQWRTVVADPWTYYGDRMKSRLSLTLISKDFSSEFYQAYNAVLPLELEFDERVDLYCLTGISALDIMHHILMIWKLIIRLLDPTEKYWVSILAPGER